MEVHSWAVSFMEYGNLWRSSRRLLHEFLNMRAVIEFDEYQRKHAIRMLSHLGESPDRFFNHAELYVFLITAPSYTSRATAVVSAIASLVMEVTYSLNIITTEDRFLRAAIDAGRVVKRAMVPGAFLIDTLPIRAYPGAP